MIHRLSKEDLCEELLASWLTLSATVRNERLVHSLTFREVCICNILMHAKTDDVITASDIVSQTGMLKSQVNKVVTDLEKRGILERHRSNSDKRQIHLQLTKHGFTCYQKEHQDVLLLLSRLIDSLGEEQTRAVATQLQKISQIMRQLEIEREQETK